MVPKSDNDREDLTVAETVRNEAERTRRLAGEERESRDTGREAAEVFRQGQERLREAAETARAISAETRRAEERHRPAGLPLCAVRGVVHVSAVLAGC